jgi:predicted nucleotidyltransferase
MCTQSVLNEITGKVVQAAKDSLGDKLDKVILYGSYARGDYDDESDIDIMVLAAVSREELSAVDKQICKLLGYLGYDNDVILSIHVVDCTTFYQYMDVLPFYTNAMKDGVKLYA